MSYIFHRTLGHVAGARRSLLLLGAVLATLARLPAALAEPEDRAASSEQPVAADAEAVTTDAPATEPAASTYAPTSASQAAGAPPPGDEHGIVKRAPKAGNALWVPRALLFIPRMTLEVLMAPIRGGGWAYENYSINERVNHIFFNETEEIGLFPVAGFENGFGLTLGAKGVHRNLLGEGETMSLQASFGGRFRQSYSARAVTGNRFTGLSFGLQAGYERRPRDVFFGIGNDDRIDTSNAQLDPFQNSGAVRSRYRQDIARVTLEMDVALLRHLSLRIRSSLQSRQFGTSPTEEDSQNIEENFQVGELTGYADGLSNSYNEVELRLDTRTALSRFESSATPGGGWLLAGFAGLASGFGDDPSNYVRYGLHLQRYFRLARGPRTLAFRAYLEGVTADYDEVPFVDLPKLGGNLLRGYGTGRFQDRVATVGSAEYRWDLAENMASILYVDAGRVFSGLDELSLENYRAGTGIALQLHSRKSFSMRIGLGASIGSNREQGLSLTLSLDPAFETQARTDRR